MHFKMFTLQRVYKKILTYTNWKCRQLNTHSWSIRVLPVKVANRMAPHLRVSQLVMWLRCLHADSWNKSFKSHIDDMVNSLSWKQCIKQEIVNSKLILHRPCSWNCSFIFSIFVESLVGCFSAVQCFLLSYGEYIFKDLKRWLHCRCQVWFSNVQFQLSQERSAWQNIDRRRHNTETILLLDVSLGPLSKTHS